MKRVSPEAGRITGSTIIGLCLLLIIGLGIWLYISGRSGPLLATLRMGGGLVPFITATR